MTLGKAVLRFESVVPLCVAAPGVCPSLPPPDDHLSPILLLAVVLSRFLRKLSG